MFMVQVGALGAMAGSAFVVSDTLAPSHAGRTHPVPKPGALGSVRKAHVWYMSYLRETQWRYIYMYTLYVAVV